MKYFRLENVPKKLFIGGKWKEASDGRNLPVVNPATGAIIASVADATAEDGRQAVSAANSAQGSFAAMTPESRAQILLKMHSLLLESKRELAAIITTEMGKPFKEACGEIEYSAGYLHWYAQEGLRVQGYHSESPSGRGQIVLSREPVGVSLLITPWNFPLAMGTRKIAPAVAAGCAVVVKPAEKTPLTMLYLARLFEEAGIPEGALNVLSTSRAADLSTPILEEGLVRHLSFTGSTRVGSTLRRQAAQNMIRTSLELGGNAPFIVFQDVDLDRAVEEVTTAKMRNMGEACTAANRILVHEGVHDEFAQKLADRFSRFTIGNGLDDEVELGPMVDQQSCKKLQSLVDDAVSRGARLLTGGQGIDGQGSFYPATVLAGVSRDSQLMSTELFGPVAAISSFTNEADAISLANDTEYGLAGYVMTDDLARAMRVSRRLEVGMVGINSGLISDVAAPLGGIKASGIGREGGVLGIDEFLEYKYTFIPH